MKSSGSKTILFDIDRTLLNTDLFAVRLDQLISEIFNIELSIVEQKTTAYISELPAIFYFSVLELVKLFEPSAKDLELFKNEYSSNRFLYPKFLDVLPVLEYLKNLNYKIGIYSEGTPEFQKTKLFNLHIEDYVNSELIFIGQSKRTPEFISKIPSNCIVVDDNHEVIDFLCNYGKGFDVVYLDRNGIHHPKSDNLNYRVVRSLLDLMDLYK